MSYQSAMLAEWMETMITKKTKLYDVLAYVVVIGAPIILGTALGWVVHKIKDGKIKQ